VEPRGRRRRARLRQHLRRHARLDLTPPPWQSSLPTLNWLRLEEPSAVPALPEILAAAAGAGFTAVGLDAITVARHLRDGGGPERVARLLRRHRLACTDVGVLVVDRPSAEADAASLAELAAATGARLCIAVFDTRPTPATLSALVRCGAVLSEADARVALEFVAYTGVPTLRDAIEICGVVGWERCGVLLDSWHFFRGGAAWDELRSVAADRLALVHVNDGADAGDDRVLESRNRRLPAGRGTFPLATLAAALAELGYGGVVSAEVLSEELRGLPLDVAARELMASLQSFCRGARS
jgi:sugar phosphate isomerase/epimerase